MSPEAPEAPEVPEAPEAPEVLVLASGSPRRHELLLEAAIRHTIIKPQVQESPLGHETPAEFALRMAVEKAEAVSEKNPYALVLAADTIVVVGSGILGKPSDQDKSRQMIERLNGKRHEVISGVVLLRQQPFFQRKAVESSTIIFKQLSIADIEKYVETREGIDKAGAYGIQGVGGTLIESVEGSYSNVVGLPMEVVKRFLSEAGYYG